MGLTSQWGRPNGAVPMGPTTSQNIRDFDFQCPRYAWETFIVKSMGFAYIHAAECAKHVFFNKVFEDTQQGRPSCPSGAVPMGPSQRRGNNGSQTCVWMMLRLNGRRASQRSLHNAPIFRLLLKVGAVSMGPTQWGRPHPKT